MASSGRRVIALGDFHGDLAKARAAMRLGGLIDSTDHWAGGTTVAVQVGDQLDRGGDEIAILLLLERLKAEAAAAGGVFSVLNGNHETMSAMGQFRYASADGLADFRRWKRWYTWGQQAKAGCGIHTPPLRRPSDRIHPNAHARYQALAHGGPLATRFLAPQQTVVAVDGSLFVHGGMLPEHARLGFDHINHAVSRWLRGKKGASAAAKPLVRGKDSLVWSRHFGHERAANCDCELLRETLEVTGMDRMVVGHTIQQNGITTACGDAVLRVDVGLSKGCIDGRPQVLEITEDSHVRILDSATGAHTIAGIGEGAPNKSTAAQG